VILCAKLCASAVKFSTPAVYGSILKG
jgi:hypothetical protein